MSEQKDEVMAEHLGDSLKNVEARRKLLDYISLIVGSSDY